MGLRGSGAGATAGEAIGVPALDGRVGAIHAVKTTHVVARTPQKLSNRSVVPGLAALAFWSVATPASAETRGYVSAGLPPRPTTPISPSTVRRLAKNPDGVKGAGEYRPGARPCRGERQARRRHSIIRMPCRRIRISRRWSASTPTALIWAVRRRTNSSTPRPTRRSTISSGARSAAPNHSRRHRRGCRIPGRSPG